MYCAIAIFIGSFNVLKNGSALASRTESLNAEMPRNAVIGYLELYINASSVFSILVTLPSFSKVMSN